MTRSISGSVGLGGANRSADVTTVQQMLNQVPANWGGPVPALKVDGFIGPKTIGAIRHLQQVQLGTIFFPDGRIDVNGADVAAAEPHGRFCPAGSLLPPDA